MDENAIASCDPARLEIRTHKVQVVSDLWGSDFGNSCIT
jgi:hypothetical protein